MAVHDEERALELEPETTQLQCHVARRAEVLHDHDVRWLRAQCELDGAHAAEVAWLGRRRIRLEKADPDPRLGVEVRPLRFDGVIAAISEVEDLDVMATAAERERKECRRRPEPAGAVIPERLVGDERDALAHQADQPPSATRFAPVTYDDASDARKTTGPTTSPTSAIRPSGMRCV